MSATLDADVSVRRWVARRWHVRRDANREKPKGRRAIFASMPEIRRETDQQGNGEFVCCHLSL